MADYKYVLGIDLGTTNTLAYYMEGGKLKQVKFKGNQMLPSVLYVDKSGKQYVGQQAVSRGGKDHRYMVRSSKKYIGDYEKNKTWGLRGKIYTPTEVAAEILKEVRRRFIAQLELDENETIVAVITVPAYFNNNRVSETRKAGAMAGLEVLAIEPEPMMAAVAAARHADSGEGYVLVVDIGGGTFDLSVLKANAANHVYEAIALDGDPNLGGDDFDDALVDYFARLIEDQQGIDLRGVTVSGLAEDEYDGLMATLREAARAAKVELSGSEETEVDLPDLLPDFDFHAIISREQFDDICHDIYDKIFRRMENFVNNSTDFPKSDIGKLVLAGGSCYIPYIKNRVAEMFPGLEDEAGDERSMLVAKGAAHMAAARAHGLGDGENVTIRSIVAHSLGVMVLDHNTHEKVLSKILPRGKKYGNGIACQNSEVFTTTVDNQTEIPVLVYEAGNDAEDIAGISYHKFYGSIHLTNIPPAPKGTPRIQVTFAYDENQRLTVTATDLGTGQTETDVFTSGQKIDIPETSPLDVVLLIDKSGSMRGSEMDEAKQAAHNLVDEKMIDLTLHRLAIVAFNDDAEIRSPLTHNEQGELRNAIDGIEPKWGTNMIAAFDAASSLLSDSGSRDRVVIMVTDGYPNTRNKTIASAQNLIGQGIRVFAVGVGSGVDLAFLCDMVGVTNAYQLNNMQELTKAFGEILQLITKC